MSCLANIEIITFFIFTIITLLCTAKVYLRFKQMLKKLDEFEKDVDVIVDFANQIREHKSTEGEDDE